MIKVSRNLVVVKLAAVCFYGQFVIGMLSKSVSGLAALPFFAATFLIVGLKDTVIDKRILVSYLTVCIYLMLLFLIGDFNNYSAYKFTFLFIKFYSCFFIGYFCFEYLKDFMRVGYFCLLIFAIYSALQAFKLDISDINNRLFVGVYNPIWIARHAFELFFISWLLLDKKKFTLTLIFILCLILTYKSGSKGALVAAVVVGLAYFNSNKQLKSKNLILFLFLSTVFCVAWATFSLVEQDSYIFQRFLSIVPSNSSSEIYNESRLVVWPRTVSLLFEQDILSLLLGNGLGSFGNFYLGYTVDFKIYPHNIILELLVELGLIVTLFIILLFVCVYKVTKSNVRFVLLYFVIVAMFSGDLLLNEFIFLYLGLSLKSILKQRVVLDFEIETRARK